MQYINIGNVKIEKTAALAPMASVADRAYRYICKEFGASYMVSEMASSNGMYYSSKKTAELLTVTEFEHPMAVQLFGDNPQIMALAAKQAQEYKPQIIDINMGCPVPKVAGNGSGCALMRDPKKASEIVKAVVASTDLPVTVKFRKGWDDDNVNAVEFAKLMEQSGVSAVTVHGRTRQQMYSPGVDIDIIARVKDAVSIPVIANGDIVDVESAVNMYEKTGCDLIMIARASYGNPWIFAQIKEYMQLGKLLPEPDLQERIDVMLRHVKMICDFKGERVGMREARKNIGWYLKGLRGAAQYRVKANSFCEYEQLEDLCKTILDNN